jgi:hypothetical protein
MNLRFPHVPEEWVLYTDVSKLSQKAVILFNGKVKQSTLVAFSVAKKKIIRLNVTLTECSW